MSQMFSDEVNLVKIFSHIDYLAILRMSPDFPNYKAGSDVDLLCSPGGYTIDDLRSQLPLLKTTFKGGGHVHLDHIVDGKIDIRFDLYSKVISSEFTRDMFRSCTVKMIGMNAFNVPSEEFDGMLKCYEYLKHPRRKAKYKEYLKYKDRLDEYTN